MTTDPESADIRSASCKANLDSEFPTCERCGLAWKKGAPAPACDVMSITRLRQVLLGEAAALEGSHHSIVAMAEAGMRADPVPALQRATALRGVLLFVDRCADSPVIIDELKRIARKLKREAEDDKAEGEREHG